MSGISEAIVISSAGESKFFVFLTTPTQLKMYQMSNIFRYDLGKCNLVEPGKVSPERPVPKHINKPSYYFVRNSPSSGDGPPEIKTDSQIQSMRDSCKLAANILKKTCGFAKV